MSPSNNELLTALETLRETRDWMWELDHRLRLLEKRLHVNRSEGAYQRTQDLWLRASAQLPKEDEEEEE